MIEDAERGSYLRHVYSKAPCRGRGTDGSASAQPEHLISISRSTLSKYTIEVAGVLTPNLVRSFATGELDRQKLARTGLGLPLKLLKHETAKVCSSESLAQRRSHLPQPALRKSTPQFGIQTQTLAPPFL
jgi:hypothetical protein